LKIQTVTLYTADMYMAASRKTNRIVL